MKLYRLPILLLLLLPMLLQTACTDSEPSEQPNKTASPKEDSSRSKQVTIDSSGIRNDYGPERGIWQKPEMVISLMGDLNKKTVVDIGAGTGFFALKLARLAEKVIAIDIDPRFINYLDSVRVWELPKKFQDRLEIRAATPTSPNLNPEEADIIMIVNTYIYLPNRIRYINNLKNSLKPGGKLLIINFKKKRMPEGIGPPKKIRVPLYQVEDELTRAGYTLVSSDDTSLDYQYIVLVEK